MTRGALTLSGCGEGHALRRVGSAAMHGRRSGRKDEARVRPAEAGPHMPIAWRSARACLDEAFCANHSSPRRKAGLNPLRGKRAATKLASSVLAGDAHKTGGEKRRRILRLDCNNARSVDHI